MGLKDFFFEKDDTDKKDQSPNTNPAAGGTGKTSFARRLPELSNNAETPSASVTNIMDSLLPSPITKSLVPDVDQSKLHAHFDQVLATSSGSGPNYFTFGQMLNEMGDLPDAPKYKGAFGALKTQGLSKQSLLDSANNFLAVLDKDKENFRKAALDSQKKSKDQIELVNNLVQLNNQKIEQAKTDIALQIKQLEKLRDDQVQKLQKEIEDNKRKVAPLEEEAAKMNDRIEAFDIACKDYKSMIAHDIQKIQTIIPN